MSLHAQTCPSVLLTLCFSPPSPVIFQPWQRGTGLKNTLIPSLAETEQRTDIFSAHKKGCQVSTTLIRHRRTHPAIPNPSENQAATVRLPSSCTALSHSDAVSLPSPQRGSYTKTLCFLPADPTVLVSPACASAESRDGNAAQQSTGRGWARPPGANPPSLGQGRGGGRGGGSAHAAGAKLNTDPYFCPNVSSLFVLTRKHPKTTQAPNQVMVRHSSARSRENNG